MVVETFPFAPLVGDPLKEDFPTSQERDSVADPPRKTKMESPDSFSHLRRPGIMRALTV
jgi:hypothetical protein